ncbi:unnamed protein product [Merluccius merluccius]
MAWPCITRACCMSRLWSQLDKADIAVPLVFTKYAADGGGCDAVQRVQLQPPHHKQARRPRAAAADAQPSAAAAPRRSVSEERVGGAGCGGSSVTRQDFKHWKVRPEPSCKPRNEYRGPETPFDTETQYQNDFKPWPLPKRCDHPWMPKPPPPPRRSVSVGGVLDRSRSKREVDGGAEKSAIADRVQEKDTPLVQSEERRKRPAGERRVVVKVDGETEGGGGGGGGRAAVDALNRQIKEEVTSGSSYRTEFKAYKDVKPARMIRARSQYLPPDDQTNLETSYSATYKGVQAKQQPADNKALERRRIRSLYSEPYLDPSKQADRYSASRSKPKKAGGGGATTGGGPGKPAKKAKQDKQSAALKGSKKKAPAEGPGGSCAAPGDKEKSKEMNNKLAEAKEVVLKQHHYIQLCQPIRDIGWVQTLKQHLWGCALPDPRDAHDEVLRAHQRGAQGAAVGESEPLVVRPEARRTAGVVRFAPDVKPAD